MFRFTTAIQDKYVKRFWRMPISLIDWLPTFWNGSKSGDDMRHAASGAVASVLPVLALHAWASDTSSSWTRWAYVSRRRIAVVSGRSLDTVARGIGRLRRLGLLEQRFESAPGNPGARITRYRLKVSTFYPREGEEFFMYPGTLLYGGAWSLLPASAHHLYLAICCRDPILSERDYAKGVYKRGKKRGRAKWEEGLYSIKDLLSEVRDGARRSVSQWAIDTGMSRVSVIGATRILTARFNGESVPTPFVKRGRPNAWNCRWLAPHRRTASTMINPELLNDRAWVGVGKLAFRGATRVSKR